MLEKLLKGIAQKVESSSEELKPLIIIEQDEALAEAVKSMRTSLDEVDSEIDALKAKHKELKKAKWAIIENRLKSLELLDKESDPSLSIKNGVMHLVVEE